MFLIIWILTPTVFWPMIHELYGSASGKIVKSDAELIHLARRWIICDWLRVAMISVIRFICPGDQSSNCGKKQFVVFSGYCGDPGVRTKKQPVRAPWLRQARKTA